MVEIAVVGAGNWGKNLVRNFDALPNVNLRYVCDLNAAVRGQMDKLYPQTEVTADYAAILADPSLDAVVVAVEVPAHFELGKLAIEAGKHTYIEKPLTQSPAEAKELVDRAAKRGVKLMVGHLLEYHPCVNYIKDAIAKGLVGEPRYLYSQRLNLGVVRQAENAWWSLAPHDVSVACYLFDADPVSVSADGQAYLQEGVEDVVFATLRYADGKMAHIHVSWLDPHKTRNITLVGSEKMITFDDMEASEKVRVYDKGAVVPPVDSVSAAIGVRNGDILMPSIPATEPLKLECKHFIECIEKDMTPRSDGKDGLRVVRIIEAGAQSLLLGGKPVRLD